MHPFSDTFPIRRIYWLLLTILIVLLYAPSINAPFVYDDKIEVVGNTTIRYLDQWRDILLYNPARALLQLTYALNFHYGQFNPYDYHMTNILIHIATVAATFMCLESLAKLFKHTAALHFSIVGTAIWTLHPMATESIIYITGRSESLCALFSILAVGLKAKSLSENHLWLNIAAGLSLLAACLCKEVAAVLPLLFISLEYLATGRLNKRQSIYHLSLLGIFILLRFYVVSKSVQGASFIPTEVERPLLIQIMTQMEVWQRYWQLWLVPIGQTIFHHIPDADSHSIHSWGFALGWIILLSLGWKLSTTALQKWLWLAMILVLLPSSSIARLQENMAEHRSYQMGLYFLTYLLLFIPDKWWRSPKIFFSFSILVASVLGMGTYQRNQVWQSEVKLWQEATILKPQSPKAWYGLGDAHRFAKEFEPALAAFATCVRLDEGDLDCWNNLGITHAEMNNHKAAKQAWLSALEQNSAYCKAHTNLGFLAYQQEHWDEALVELRSTLVYCPNNVIAHYGLGLIYYRPRLDVQKAIHHFDQVLQINPNFDYASDARAKLLELTW